jgi:hypothetical protein
VARTSRFPKFRNHSSRHDRTAHRGIHERERRVGERSDDVNSRLGRDTEEDPNRFSHVEQARLNRASSLRSLAQQDQLNTTGPEDPDFKYGNRIAIVI